MVKRLYKSTEDRTITSDQEGVITELKVKEERFQWENE